MNGLTEKEKPQRVQKILAEAGIASRRTCERLIEAGRVTVDGKPARLGDQAYRGKNRICVDGIPVEGSSERRYFVLNKPKGTITSTSDTHSRATVMDFLPSEVRKCFRIFPVGRLDKDSSGLILLTNDGFLANRILHPRYAVAREYIVEVEPPPSPRDIKTLRRGVDLEEGNTGPARVSIIAVRGSKALVRVVITSGRKRQIRRSFAKLGYRVNSLIRVRIGPLSIGNLKEGEIRELTREEVRSLYEATGLGNRPTGKGG